MPPLPANPLGVKVVAFASTGIFVDAIVIGLRLWARALKKRRLVVGDYLIVAAWFIALADLFRKVQGYRWGVGLHLSQILATDPSHLLDTGKLSFAGYFVWIACITCIKLSILFVYQELFFVITWFVRCVYVTMALCILAFISNVVGLCTLCHPFPKNYDRSYVGGSCSMTLLNSFLLSGSINMVLDVILVILPLPVVWTLRISKLKKIGVSLMFGLGFVIVAVVAVRFHMIKEQNPDDFIHDGEPTGIVTSLELYLGMISACLPFFGPPMAKIKSSILNSQLIGTLSSRSTQDSTKNSTSTYGKHGHVELRDIGGQSEDNLKSGYASSKKSDEEALAYIHYDNFVTVPESWPSTGQRPVDSHSRSSMDTRGEWREFRL